MKHPLRPKDSNSRAVYIAKLATGEIQELNQNEGKNPSTTEKRRLSGVKGGKARAKKLTSKKRKEIAKKAAQTRWGR